MIVRSWPALLLIASSAALVQQSLFKNKAERDDRVHQRARDDFQHRFCRRCHTSPSLLDPVDSPDGWEHYTIVAEFGSLGSKFDLTVDTGSPNLVLINPNCTIHACMHDERLKPRRPFKYKESTSFVNHSISDTFLYAAGYVDVTLISDRFAVGPLSVTAQDAGLAYYVSDKAENFTGDGLLGLSYPRDRPTMPVSPLERLDEQVALFTTFFRKMNHSSKKDDGSITFGSLDPFNCQSETRYIDLELSEKFNRHRYWMFATSGIVYDGTRRTEKRDEPLWAMLDTAAPILGGPDQEILDFVEMNGGYFDEELGYVANCTNSFIDFKIEIDGITYKVPHTEFVLPHKSGLCRLAVDAAPVEKGVPEYILGTPFHRAYCIVHDVRNRRVAFQDVQV